MSPAAAQARDLAAASLIRAFIADDQAAGMLIIDQNTQTPEDGARLVVAVVKQAARTLLAANGYDVAKTLKVIDGWVTVAARQASP